MASKEEILSAKLSALAAISGDVLERLTSAVNKEGLGGDERVNVSTVAITGVNIGMSYLTDGDEAKKESIIASAGRLSKLNKFEAMCLAMFYVSINARVLADVIEEKYDGAVTDSNTLDSVNEAMDALDVILKRGGMSAKQIKEAEDGEPLTGHTEEGEEE